MKAHVICYNDGIEYVVIGSEEKALNIMSKLRAENYNRNKWNFESEEEYNNTYYWHIHTVGADIEKE